MSDDATWFANEEVVAGPSFLDVHVTEQHVEDAVNEGGLVTRRLRLREARLWLTRGVH